MFSTYDKTIITILISSFVLFFVVVVVVVVVVFWGVGGGILGPPPLWSPLHFFPHLLLYIGWATQAKGTRDVE